MQRYLLEDARGKARIFVNNSCHLKGVLDEYSVLEEDEVFI